MTLGRAALALSACAMTFPATPTREQTQDEIRRTFVSEDKLHWLDRTRDDEVGLCRSSVLTIAHKPLQANMACVNIASGVCMPPPSGQ